MKTYTFDIQIPSAEAPDFIDITDNIANCIAESQISNGIVVVFSKHTTAAITIQENEPLLLEDFKALLDNFSSKKINIDIMILMSVLFICMKMNALMGIRTANIYF